MDNNQVVKQKSGLAIAALVLGAIGFALAFIPVIRFVTYILAVLALIFGIIPLCKKKSVVIAIIAIVLAVAGSVISYCYTAANVKKIDDAITDLTADHTQDILENDIEVTFGEFTITEGDLLDDYALPVTVKNVSGEKHSFSITIEAVDADGNRIDTDTIWISDLNPDQSQTFDEFTLITEEVAQQLVNAEFKVADVSKH